MLVEQAVLQLRQAGAAGRPPLTSTLPSAAVGSANPPEGAPAPSPEALPLVRSWHHGLVARVGGGNPAYGPSVRLAKRCVRGGGGQGREGEGTAQGTWMATASSRVAGGSYVSLGSRLLF